MAKPSRARQQLFTTFFFLTVPNPTHAHKRVRKSALDSGFNCGGSAVFLNTIDPSRGFEAYIDPLLFIMNARFPAIWHIPCFSYTTNMPLTYQAPPRTHYCCCSYCSYYWLILFCFRLIYFHQYILLYTAYYIYIYMHACICVNIRTYLYIYTCMISLCVCIYTYVHMHIHIYTYMYTHAYI